MTGEMDALARRAVACKGWHWMPGMLSDHGRIVEINVYGLLVGYTTGIILKSGAQGWPRGWEASASFRLPDLTDPATLGCVLALVREAWEDPHASVWYDSEYWQSGNGWSWHAKKSCRVDYESEAEALVAALEAAP